MGRLLLDCINELRIKNAITMTVNNVTSNDKGNKILIKKLSNLNDGGKFFYIRCMTNILKLTVKYGLKNTTIMLNVFKQS